MKKRMQLEEEEDKLLIFMPPSQHILIPCTKP